MSQEKSQSFASEFYRRQATMKELGWIGQRKLAKSKVAVVGVGGLGTVASLYLALAGVGHLRVIDQDTVELQNLHRQILYSMEDLDYPKVEIAQKQLMKFNPHLKVDPIPESLDRKNVEGLLNGVDCVVDGLDNMKTRYLVNRACVKLRIPYVFGAAIGMEGNLSVFAPPETPCLECVLPGIEDSDLQTCNTRGVLSATPGIVGTMEAMETIKVLAGIGSPLKAKLMICDFSDMNFTTIAVSKRSNCPACQGTLAPLETRENLVWLCGQKTANVNPEKPLALNLDQTYETIKDRFRIRLKSHLAIVFYYKTFEISFFKGGRMLIKGVKTEESALKTYKELLKQLGLSQ